MKRNETILPLEQRIIDVCFRCIYKYGVSRSTIRIIAKEANIKPTAIQYYFPQKENLLNRLIENLHEKIISSFESSYSPSDPPEIKLEKILINMQDFILKKKPINTVYLSLLLNDGVRNPSIKKIFVEQIKRMLNSVEKMLNEGIEKGIFNKEENINSIARSFIIFARGCAIQGLLEGSDKNVKGDINLFKRNIKKILLNQSCPVKSLGANRHGSSQVAKDNSARGKHIGP